LDARQKPCVVFVANRNFALVSSRLLLIKHFLSSGWSVIVATPPDSFTPRLIDLGVFPETIKLERNSFSPWQDSRTFINLLRIYQVYQPKLVHQFHPKPIILGGIAARYITNCKVVNSITGLGREFTQNRLKRLLAIKGYQFSLTSSSVTIFQNPDDRQLFLENGWLPEYKSRLIIGSGVDIERFRPTNYPSLRGQPLRVLMVARLLWSKGVREFIEAAEIIKNKYPNVCFQLAGEWDDTPDSIDKKWFQSILDQDVIKFLGYCNNIEECLQNSDIFVLPSYYPEGVPRTLLEAAACGVPVVTTDSPGCKEAVMDGETGYLVPTRDSKSLAKAIERLINDKSLRYKMGQSGRRLIEKKFDIRTITQQHLDVYREIGIQI
jgi:glycosyltransferase involved in cell wall biosynthesis